MAPEEPSSHRPFYKYNQLCTHYGENDFHYSITKGEGRQILEKRDYYNHIEI